MVRGHLVQRQGVAVFEMSGGGRSKAHVNRHRLAVPSRQGIDRFIQWVPQPGFVIARVELDAAAGGACQIFLNPLRQMCGRGAALPEKGAVQPYTVVKEIGRVIVVCGPQAAVAHDHAVDNPQVPVRLPQVRGGIMVPHRLRHLLELGLVLWKQVQMGVNDFHESVSFQGIR